MAQGLPSFPEHILPSTPLIHIITEPTHSLTLKRAVLWDLQPYVLARPTSSLNSDEQINGNTYDLVIVELTIPKVMHNDLV